MDVSAAIDPIHEMARRRSLADAAQEEAAIRTALVSRVREAMLEAVHEQLPTDVADTLAETAVDAFADFFRP